VSKKSIFASIIENRMSYKVIILHNALIALILSACTGYDATSDVAYPLRFSTDTLRFDTVFSTLGSATHRLTVYNPNPYTVRTRISRADARSPFRYNADGTTLTAECDVEIAGRDSMYLFAEVTVDPQNSDWPVRILDSLLFETGRHRQQVYSEAYGQDVVILKNATVGNETWQSAKPYLIEGTLVVDTLQTLHIQQGTRIFLTSGANIRIKGTLIATGSVEHPVLFSGTRTDKNYGQWPGQWGSILLTTASRDNLLRHVEIRNGTNGLLIGNPNSHPAPLVKLEAVAIHDMSYSGLMGFSSDLNVSNCLVYNCNYYTVGLFCGGNCTFTHCTFANPYSSHIRRKGVPVFSANNVYQNRTGDVPLLINCFNSIIEGNADEELSLGNGVSCRFSYCLIRTQSDASATAGFETVLARLDPMFVRPEEGDFRLSKTSPARDAGNRELAETTPLDMLGNDRLKDLAPDIGAFEWKD
jgi:hypothetical protein